MKPATDHDPYSNDRVRENQCQDLCQLGDDGLRHVINGYPSEELNGCVHDAAPGPAVES